MKPKQAEFQFPPVSHTHDPTSSKEAEKQITQSGRRQTDANRVLAVLTLSPGKTATEIGEELWPEDLRGQIGKARRRLSDLKNIGEVYNRIRVDEDGKNERESRWWPVRE
jgi:hypothetical protein